MTLFEFTITLEYLVDDLDAIDAFYSRVDDVSVETRQGKTFLHFDREAASLDNALRQAASEVQHEGWQVSEIAVDPHCVMPLSIG